MSVPRNPERPWMGRWQDNLLAMARNTKLPMMTRLLYAVDSRVTWNGHAVFKVGELADILGYYDGDGVIHPYSETRKLLAKAVEAGVLVDSRPPGSRGPIRCIQVNSGLRCGPGKEESKCSWCVDADSKDSRYRARQVQSDPEKNQEQSAVTRVDTAIGGPSAPTKRVRETQSSRKSGCQDPTNRADTTVPVATIGCQKPTVRISDTAIAGVSEPGVRAGEDAKIFKFAGKRSEPEPAPKINPIDPIDPDEWARNMEWIRQTCVAEGIEW